MRRARRGRHARARARAAQGGAASTAALRGRQLAQAFRTTAEAANGGGGARRRYGPGVGAHVAYAAADKPDKSVFGLVERLRACGRWQVLCPFFFNRSSFRAAAAAAALHVYFSITWLCVFCFMAAKQLLLVY